MTIAEILAKEFGVQLWQTEAVIALLDEGNTLPFIARYRKEAHGKLDDTLLRDMAERLEKLRGLQKRREEITESLKKLDKWTEELQQEIDGAESLARLEDIYRPYRPKRRTRGTMAREKGLEPLAEMLLLQMSKATSPEALAEGYVDPEKGVNSPEEALQGAMDIIAERISDDASIRAKLKRQYATFARIHTTQAGEEESVYTMYYDRQEPLRQMPSHRVLAMNRGEKEGFLKVALEVNEQSILRIIRDDYVIQTGSLASDYVSAACEDY